MGGTTKTSSAHKCSRTTSKIMWAAGLPGHKRTDWVSSAWKILSSSLVVLWSPHGLPLCSWTTLWTRKSLWRAEHSITLVRALIGPTFGDAYYITIVVSSQFVPNAMLSRHVLMFHGKQESSMNQDQCVFIRGFRVKYVLFRIRPIRIEADYFLVTATTAGTIRCK